MSWNPKKYVEASPIQGRVWFFHTDEDDKKTNDVTWSQIIGKPDLFPPSDHTHDWSDITNKPSLFPAYPGPMDTSWVFNSLRNDDEVVLLNDDDVPLYNDGAIFDNPPVPTRQFATVQEMLDADGDSWDGAMTWEFESGDGLTKYWIMRGDPALVDNESNIRQTTDGYGFAVCVAQIR